MGTRSTNLWKGGALWTEGGPPSVRRGQLAALALLPDVDEEVEVDADEEVEPDELSLADDDELSDDELSDDELPDEEAAVRLSVR